MYYCLSLADAACAILVNSGLYISKKLEEKMSGEGFYVQIPYPDGEWEQLLVESFKDAFKDQNKMILEDK